MINLIIGWCLYFSSIFKVGSCSDESLHLYPLLGIFKIRICRKYSLNFSSIWSSPEIILLSLTKLILECFVTFSDKNRLTVFQIFYYQLQPNIPLSVTTKYSIISYDQILYYQLQPNIRLSVITKYSIINYNQIFYYQLQPNIRLSVTIKYCIISYNQIFDYQSQPNIRLSVTIKYSIISYNQIFHYQL